MSPVRPSRFPPTSPPAAPLTMSSTPPASSAPPDARPPACPRCGRALPADAVLGACPLCLLAAGFASEAATTPGDAPPAPSLDELAHEFPQLELLELIGRGGMGAVYKARQRALGRLVALKLLRPGLDADPSFAERFTHEARALAQLNHPGIVTLYEFGRTPSGRYFILMEFVDGVNLRQLLAAGRLAPREALAIIPPLCDALQYAHDRGLVHRDIKPENILVDRLGRVKIADFGLVKLSATPASDLHHSSFNLHPSAASDRSLSDGARVLGTPRYMAPEQRAHPASVDHRADIYALGVVLYQMLTGELPDAKQLQPPSQHVELDVRLDAIVLRALEKNPSLRYAAASELKTQVETIANTVAATPAPGISAPVPPPAAAPSSTHSRRVTLVMTLSIAAACVALFSAGAPIFQRTRIPTEHRQQAVTLGPLQTGEAKAATLPIELPPADSTSVQILETKLAQAESELREHESRQEAGLEPIEALRTARDNVALLKAEIEDDTVRIARIKYVAADRRLEDLRARVRAGLLSNSDLEAAQSAQKLSALELASAVIAKGPPTNPVFVTAEQRRMLDLMLELAGTSGRYNALETEFARLERESPHWCDAIMAVHATEKLRQLSADMPAVFERYDPSHPKRLAFSRQLAVLEALLEGSAGPTIPVLFTSQIQVVRLPADYAFDATQFDPNALPAIAGVESISSIGATAVTGQQVRIMSRLPTINEEKPNAPTSNGSPKIAVSGELRVTATDAAVTFAGKLNVGTFNILTPTSEPRRSQFKFAGERRVVWKNSAPWGKPVFIDLGLDDTNRRVIGVARFSKLGQSPAP